MNAIQDKKRIGVRIQQDVLFSLGGLAGVVVSALSHVVFKEGAFTRNVRRVLTVFIVIKFMTISCGIRLLLHHATHRVTTLQTL